MLDVRRHREERAGHGAMPVAVLEELDLSLEHVERVGVIGVGVRVNAFEVRPEGELEYLEVWQLREDTVSVRRPLALTRPDEVRLVHHDPS